MGLIVKTETILRCVDPHAFLGRTSEIEVNLWQLLRKLGVYRGET
jgi:hypothetical protein